jgi:general secretion pathway protein G
MAVIYVSRTPLMNIVSASANSRHRDVIAATAPAKLHASPCLSAGFTLIEIMVVVVIIGIISAMVAPSVIRRIDDAQISKAKQDLRAYATALDLFRLDNYKYPTTDQGLKALVQQPGDSTIRNWKPGGYIGGLRKDPWNNDYQYVYPGSKGGEYDLFTLGADNQEGGEGINADIGNWNVD